MNNKIKMVIDIPEFMTNTRVISCTAINCKNFGKLNLNGDIGCQLKSIQIDDEGKCDRFKRETDE